MSIHQNFPAKQPQKTIWKMTNRQKENQSEAKQPRSQMSHLWIIDS
jgi:hypothetical protein